MLQHRFGGFDPQCLKVGGGKLAGGGLEMAHEGAPAHTGTCRHRLDGDFVPEILLQISLDRADAAIVMRLRYRKHGVARLALVQAWHRQQQGFCRVQRHLVSAEFLDQIETDVDRAADAAAAQDTLVFGHEIFRVPAHAWEARRHIAGHRPVRGRYLVVEQAGRRQISRSHAYADKIGALRIVAT